MSDNQTTLPGIEAQSTQETTRACLRCKGEGKVFREGFTYDGTTYPDKWEVCNGCKGEKVFNAPDMKEIVQAITTSRGATEGKRRFRASFPSKGGWKDTATARAYYVWRLVRFHGGKDTTMPMTADLILRSDPYKKELDSFADAVAKTVFGTDMAAAMRWGKAFGII